MISTRRRALRHAACVVLVLVALVVWLVPAGAGALDCTPDPALTEAATELLVEGGHDDPSRIDEAVRRAGSNATSAHALSTRPGDDAEAARWLERLAQRNDAPLACGEAESDSLRILVAASLGGSLRLLEGTPPRVAVTLAPGFREPHLVFRGDHGDLVRVPVDVDVLAEGAPIPDGLEEPIHVQLVAEGRSGPKPIASLRIGGRPDATPHSTRRPSAGASFDLRAAVDALRARHGAGGLRANRVMSAEAESHARRVCAAGRVGHRLASGEDPEQRLRRRGLSARVVGETVARADTEADAVVALEDSPSHLMTLVDRRFTDGGYGVATDAEGHRCVVVLLAAWPRVVAH